MLPDYPTFKNEMDEALRHFLRARIAQYAPMVRLAPSTRQFEGNTSVVKRPEGAEESVDFRATAGELKIPVEELPSLSIHNILARMDAVAKEMARGMEGNMLNSLNEQLEKHGRTIDGGGKPLSASLILEAFAGMSIAFDEAGRPEIPSFIIHPDLDAGMRRAATELQENPEYERQYRALIEQKREEWLAEQASRKLVG